MAIKYKNIACLIGPPGSGKGTQSINIAQKLANNYSLIRFAVGDELRAKNMVLPTGDLSNIEQIDEIIQFFLTKEYVNYIIDGFPRDVAQLELINSKRKLGLIDQLFLVNLYFPQTENLINRLNSRYNCIFCNRIYRKSEIEQKFRCNICSAELSQRTDDLDQKVINRRLEVYFQSIDSIKQYANNNQIALYEIDADRSQEAVRSDILDLFNQFFTPEI